MSLDFTFEPTKAGEVHISRGGSVVTTLRNKSASTFLARAVAVDPAGQQQLMARAAGNYKRGNER